MNAQTPKNASEVRSFVQLVQYSSKFIPNFSQVAEPLRRLLRKDQAVIWGVEQQKAFEGLKSLTTSAKVLSYFNCKTRIVADAGSNGLGAVLLKFQEDEWRAVSYASCKLIDVERRYPQTEKEALALVWACEHFNLYVYERDFEVETDHKPLEFTFRSRSVVKDRTIGSPSAVPQLPPVVYRPGKTNIADVLSRLNQ